MKVRDVRSLNEESLFELRMRAVDLKREGYTYEEVSTMLEVSFSAVRKWWSLYRQGGRQALQLGQRGRRQGQCRSLNGEQERRVRRMITDKTPDQLKMPFALWTRQTVQELVQRQYGIQMPIRTVGRVSAALGLQPATSSAVGL